MPPRHRRFGAIRKLPSGRWQASYLTPDGRRRTSETLFDSKTDADRWLTVIRSSLIEGRWVDTEQARERLSDYMMRWIAERPGLRPRTRDLYAWLDRKYLAPPLGTRELRQLTPAVIRSWRQHLLDSGVSATMTAKAYRLLRAALNTAVDDGTLQANPCRLPGAGTETPDERPTLSVAQVFALAMLVPPRYQALVLVAAFASLRWGEVAALRRDAIDLDAGLVYVRGSVVEVAGSKPAIGPPKTDAGIRVVALPDQVVDVLRAHMELFADDDPTAFVFTGTRGNLLRRGNFNSLVGWPEAVERLGVPGLHFHDLRHTGNTLASSVPGTTVRDLMDRMGHVSMRAALIYLHKTNEADKRIAAGLTTQIASHFATDAGSLVARSLHEGGS